MKRAQPAAAEVLPASLRRYLYLTAATTGACVMIVEILGAKMLAPYFGTSHFVWTAQIAVTLVALATGYYAGGKLVDLCPRLGRVYWAMVWAAVYLDLAVLVVERVAFWCLEFRLAIGSLMASAFLFFVPLALLASVGPFFTRVITSNVSNMGGNVGRLTAVGTLGSFAGTVLISYVLVPFLPNSVTMYGTSGMLLAVAAGYFFVWGRKSTPVAAVVSAVVLGLTLGGLGVARDQPITSGNLKEVWRANSNFGRIQVLGKVHGSRLLYLNDLLDQNGYDSATGQSTDAFVYMLHDLARNYQTNIHDVLCIGLGVGLVPMQFAREGAQVDVVEINPAIAPIATRFFGLDTTQLHLTIDDGRHFLNRTRHHYDAIILDAFLGDSPPSHLFSREAFAAMRARLNPGGVLVMNTFGLLEPGQDFFAASVRKTLGATFKSVRIHGDHSEGNMYFVASDQPDLQMRQWPDPKNVNPLCRDQVEIARQTTLETDPGHGRILTDDFNPVDYYDAVNRERNRKNLAESWKKVQ